MEADAVSVELAEEVAGVDVVPRKDESRAVGAEQRRSRLGARTSISTCVRKVASRNPSLLRDPSELPAWGLCRRRPDQLPEFGQGPDLPEQGGQPRQQTSPGSSSTRPTGAAARLLTITSQAIFWSPGRVDSLDSGEGTGPRGGVSQQRDVPSWSPLRRVGPMARPILRCPGVRARDRVSACRTDHHSLRAPTHSRIRLARSRGSRSARPATRHDRRRCSRIRATTDAIGGRQPAGGGGPDSDPDPEPTPTPTPNHRRHRRPPQRRRRRRPAPDRP